jgi:DNA repair protein RecO (recombination protein O)
LEKDEAILIRRRRLTDTSLIVYWCTRSGGIVHTAAKGALRPKSTFAGKLDLFYHGEIVYSRARNSSLHTLREVSITNTRARLGADYERIQVASYFVRLAELITEPDSPTEGLYPLLARALDYLDQDTIPSAAAVVKFERRITELLGISGDEREPITVISDTYSRQPKGRKEALAACRE